jgi:hypothetical protein
MKYPSGPVIVQRVNSIPAFLAKTEEVNMPVKRDVPELIYTNHVKQRMRERYFSEDDVQFIFSNGERDLLHDGCIRYTLTDDVPPGVQDDPRCRYNRGRKIITTAENILKTVIANDEINCDFATFREYVL